MPCIATMIAQRLGPQIPIPSEQDLKEELGAKDHDDLHRIVSVMDDWELRDALKRIERKRKRLSIMESYLLAEQRVIAIAGVA